MRWTRERRARRGVAGRGQIRERNAARRTSDVFADGEVVWFWHPLLMLSSAEAYSAQPGVRCAIQSAGRRWQKKNSSPGRARISRKAIAQGRPDDPATPVVLPRAFCCTRTAGGAGTRSSLRPLLFGGTLSDHNLGVMRREIATVRPDSPEAAE